MKGGMGERVTPSPKRPPSLETRRESVRMPKTHRDLLKKRYGYAVRDIENAQLQCLLLQREFEVAHPDFAELLQATMLGLEVCLSSLQSFARHAWGHIPPTVERWRDTELEASYEGQG